MPIEALLLEKDRTLVDVDRTWGVAAYPARRTTAGSDADALHRPAKAMHDIDARHFCATSPLSGDSAARILAVWGAAIGIAIRAARPALEPHADHVIGSVLPADLA